MTTPSSPREPLPLLETKLFAPRTRSNLVSRPDLVERVRQGTRSRLTLISAPAGFGKSTLLAEWVESAEHDGARIAWLSLDAGDNYASGFWTQVIAALRTLEPGIGARALATIESGERPVEVAMTALVNDLTSVPGDVTLVLDDFHAVEALDVPLALEFLIEHMPAQTHVIISSRIDPALPLARLRARGELTEIRAADLRFKPAEADTYFNGVLHLGLTAGEVATLESRTEGWVAALQLAGLSMQGRDDAAGFIESFAGDDRYIVDYLAEEVLQRQPDDVRAFLLQTSVLSRLSGPLVDAVTERTGGKAMLEALDRQNLFLIPLDDRRRWYRYHHLFADVLRARLLDEQPDQVALLHRRATDWYEQNGEWREAIRHAMAGQDVDRAADLVELAILWTRQTRQEAVRRIWLEELPEDLIRSRPVLSNLYAGTLLVRGETEGVEAWLQAAERWLDPTPGQPGMVVVDDEAFRTLPGSIAIHRAGLARLSGDVPGTITHARRALELIDDDDQLGRGSAVALLGLSHWTIGDLEDAASLYVEAISRFERVGFLADAIGCSITLADLRLAQGRMSEALAILERGAEIGTTSGPGILRGTPDMHVGMADIFRERGDLAAATEHLARSRELGEEHDLPQNPYRSRVVEARIRQAQGDLDAAIVLLDRAARLYAGDFSPDVRPVAAVKARVRIAQGRLAEAWAWVRERGLSSSDDLTYLREFEHVSLARLLLAQGTLDGSPDAIGEARRLLDRLFAGAQDGGRLGSLLEILIIRARAEHAGDAQAAALASLEEAVAMAEPEGYVRVFLDEGQAMVTLLKQLARQRKAPGYAGRLVAAATAGISTPAGQRLVEPLSDRELEVLRLLQGDLDGPDLARELSVSLNTLRTHTRNVYAKLGVSNRRAAVRRGEELGLLAPQGQP